MKKIGLIFGGPGNEAEVSIKSARNVFKNFDLEKYKPVLVYWSKDWKFYLVNEVPVTGKVKKGQQINIEQFSKYFDIVLPMTHGKFGEDGILQGILESQRMRYCGCRVLSSSLCMDKAAFKDYLAGNKIRQARFAIVDTVLMKQDEISATINKVKKEFKLPFYVKPANSGSSIGVTKVDKLLQIKKAIRAALKHDQKIVIEEGLIGHREIEIAVLGNKELVVSLPGELKAAKDFYDYDEKYKLGRTTVTIPTKMSDAQTGEIRRLAAKVYRLCACSGFARVDFFLLNNKIYVNEINTLPGFTDISMYPMLMGKSGISYKKLINKIIELAY